MQNLGHFRVSSGVLYIQIRQRASVILEYGLVLTLIVNVSDGLAVHSICS